MWDVGPEYEWWIWSRQLRKNGADGVGWKYPGFDPETGLASPWPSKAMETGEPYPIKAYFACGTDPWPFILIRQRSNSASTSWNFW